MTFQFMVFMFCNICLCFAKDNIRIGLFFDKYQEEIPFWNIITENLEENLKLISNFDGGPPINIVPDNDIFQTAKQLCSYVKDSSQDRLVAIIGPELQSASSIMEAICSQLKVPYILTTWRPRTFQVNPNTLNLFPDPDLFSKGLAQIIQSFDWPGFVVLYEDIDGLLRLQEVLKLQEYNEESIKSQVMIEKLDIDGDNRHILKSMKHSNRIILDCHVDRIMDIFRQASEVGLLSDFSRSFFLTSLDAHTLDFAPLKTQANITTIRLFNPMDEHFKKIAYEYFPDVLPTQIRVDKALKFDAITLLTETINTLKIKGEEFNPRELQCNTLEDTFEDDLNIIENLQKVRPNDLLTGPISFLDGKRNKFFLEVIETDMLEKPIGIWNSEIPDKVYLTRNATERQAELQRRLESYNFIVTSRIGPPYLYENTKPEAYKNARYYGYSMDLITEVAKIINISFEFRITADNSYVNLVEDLVERKADLGICDFTITPQRRALIDFSMPFMNLGIQIVHKENTQEEVDNLYAFMRPINWKVWFYIWVLCIANSVTMFIVARLAPAEWENPKPWDPESKELENIWTIKNFLWLIIGSITAQGCDILPKSVSARVIAGSWWFFSLIIISSYTANLAAFLTAQKRDVTIDSVAELAAQSRVKFGLLEKGSTETFFSTSNNSLYQKMWNTMKNEKPSVFEKDNTAGVERVISTKYGLYAYIMESTGLEFEMERKCELRKIGGLLDSKSYGIGMPMDADYRNEINRAVLQLQESGKLMELKDKWWKKEREGEPCKRNVEDDSEALALSNVGGIFIVLSVGIGVAYLIAIAEFLLNVRQLSIEEHIPFMETLKCEMKFACKIFTKQKRARPMPSESTSSARSEPDHDKLSIAKSIFSKSASLLNFQTEAANGMRNRQKSTSRNSRPSSNHLRVK
ncbi:unnamed protein product [Ceutorhynchus assimilis]|uniref:Uncharacterized protein n=1 Tax=Ceutorhynchus assimilis TaxID=467358 RepID=A0A9N9MQR7_9CUCU|nr:unnamed protein product [Ceutorhynchus assimilis]